MSLTLSKRLAKTSLVKRGVNYIGLCPFPQREDPFFHSVTGERASVSVLAVARGGNVIAYRMERDGLLT